MSGDPPDDLFAREFESVLGKYYALKEARQRHPYVDDLIRVLLPYPGGLRRALVLVELEKQRKQDGLPIPPSFETAVQGSYNHHCEEFRRLPQAWSAAGRRLVPFARRQGIGPLGG